MVLPSLPPGLLVNAATGKRVAAQQSHWFRVVDGKLAEHWAVRDDLGVLRQLGVMPP